jgi:mannitol-1-/sugar-/sorbitol-6-/2-deoxyglucose-6-phosphatase
MDGLLVDSEILWHQAELEILVPLGAAIDGSAARTTKGRFVREVVEHYFDLVRWTTPSIDEVVAQILDRVGALVDERGELLPGAMRSLDLCGRLGPRALASSTPRGLIIRTLSHFGLEDAFDVIHSAEDEPYGKPHPGVFLTAAQRLDVAPAHCLVIEDSSAGVLAAKAARMACVAVPAPEERGDPTFSIADLVLGSLEELDASWLEKGFTRT